ncbi:Cytoplasmic thioredoxin isoenzyme 2 [Blyttiomyces sp. JEL0837]|nr:Cytoplasmic thioredoxin isoenzyme 2 [Blyttiomyces sp. JEL0837]
MVAITTTAQDFKTLVNSGKLTIVDFFAEWCGPCHVISPRFAQFAEKYGTQDINFTKVDVEELPEIAEEAGIRAMPTFQLYKDGVKVGEIVGANPTKLEAEIVKYSKL